ncbi:helix-turn-helix domain-containing protein [Pseudomonas cremoricolorata]|uniref:Cro/Cl family transcriptional regulator n=1 Tax=Pseudomonas cremoricolorata TaxID=157783 RepID=A0A089WPA9_9PSED|nr:XRE family transcriptional regulator [Pseudomonas cremoricolorata]AIR90416.1 Cro/Cl family transcriptional regulator [Pseudomonas cremoricolorata]
MHRHSERSGSVLQHVSHNIRQLRIDSGFSQSALSERSGVSRRMLVAIEAGEKNVSLATLDLIATALAVPFSRLVQAPDQRDLSRINELAWAGQSPGSRALLLGASQATREVELWEWRLEPGERYFSEADAEGWSEQIYVAEGCLTLVIEDIERRVLAGEFYVFASNCRYSYWNADPSVVRFVRNVVI